MTLLELLVKELPKRGGWPDGSDGCRQFPDGEICFNHVSGEPDFYSELASDVELSWKATKHPHITRSQYESAISSAIENASQRKYTAIEALFAVLDAGVSTSQDAIDIYDAIAAGKVPGVKLED